MYKPVGILIILRNKKYKNAKHTCCVVYNEAAFKWNLLYDFILGNYI